MYRCPTRGYECRTDDVAIATFPKSGTTWMTQIVHQLCTGGELEFVVEEAVPFIIDPKVG